MNEQPLQHKKSAEGVVIYWLFLVCPTGNSHWVNHCCVATVSHACVTVTQCLPLSFCKQNNWPLLLPLTLLKRCCTRCKNSNKFSFNSLAGVLGNRTPRGTITVLLPEGSCHAVTEGREVLHATIVPMFYIDNSCSKTVVPFGAIPLSPLFLSLTIATHAVLLCSTSRDHCFVIASMGINEKRALRLFF